MQVNKSRIEVLATKGSRKKDGFEWRVMRGENVLYFAVGYDTYHSALKVVKGHNKKLIKPLPIYFRGERVN